VSLVEIAQKTTKLFILNGNLHMILSMFGLQRDVSMRTHFN